MTQTATRRAYVEPSVSAISTPNLTDAESSKLLACINGVRSGAKVYFVRANNRKVTNSPKRMPNQDYRPDRGLSPGTHEGWLVQAPTNKKRKVYLHILDRARAGVDSEGPEAWDMTWAEVCAELDADRLVPKEERKWNHTRITMAGIQSFRVMATQDRHPQPVAVGVPTMPTLTPHAQALMLKGQGLMLEGQGLMLQAQGQALLDQCPQPTQQ